MVNVIIPMLCEKHPSMEVKRLTETLMEPEQTLGQRPPLDGAVPHGEALSWKYSFQYPLEVGLGI